MIRHTRAEEEAGRRELLGSTVVGRHAGLAAALIATVGANLVMGVLLAPDDRPAPARRRIGGLRARVRRPPAAIFAAVGAVAAQLTESAGGARGIAIAVLGVAFLLRVGRRRQRDLRRRSGLGVLALADRLGPADPPVPVERWWVLPAVLVTALLGWRRASRCPRGATSGPACCRPGPVRPTRRARLRSPLALAWRLHRGLLAGWAAAFAVLGVVLGGVANGVGDLVGTNQALKDVFARIGGREALVDAYLVASWRSWADRRRLRHPGDAAAAHRGDRRTGRAGAGHRGRPPAVGRQPPGVRRPRPGRRAAHLRAVRRAHLRGQHR